MNSVLYIEGVNLEELTQIYRNNDWWQRINWSDLKFKLSRIQMEIYYSYLNGNFKKGKNLMKNLINSDIAKLLAIYTITQKNKGRETVGIDCKKYTTPKARMHLSQENFNYRKYKFQPVIIKLIPKKGKYESKRISSNMRPLAIMTLKDRVMTKIVSYALTAKWEANLDSNVFGYRPGYSVQNAIYELCKIIYNKKYIIIDADIENFFENISHSSIISQISFPNTFIKKILKIKVIDDGREYRRKKGVIQGNPLSPLLANIALHGMENLFITKENSNLFLNLKNKLYSIRYADDFIILAPNRDIINDWVMPKLKQFLAERGLKLNKEKTKILTKDQGFKFLGYNIKQTGDKLIAQPIKKGFGYSIMISK